MMTTQTVLEAVSALLHSRDTPFYLLLTCASILFSVLIIFRRRKDKTGESSHHWVPVSAASLDPLVTSQPSTETLMSSVKQPRNAPTTMDKSAVTHRPAKQGHQFGQNELFLGSGNHEETYDSGELHCSKIQELISLWSNKTTVDQHQLRPSVCELLDNVIADSSHSAEHSQHDNTDVSLSDDLPQCAVTGTYQIDDLNQRSVTDSPQTDDLPQCPDTDSSQTNDLPQCPDTDFPQADVLSQCSVTDSSQTADKFQCSLTDSSHTNDLDQRPGTDSTQTNDLPQRPDTDFSRTGDLSHLSVTDTSDTVELYQRDVVGGLHTDELSLCPVADPSQTGQLSQEVLKNVSLTNALFHNTPHSGEIVQPATTVTLRSCELFQSVINDKPHPPELFHSVISDRPHPPELFQSVINDRPHSPELFHSVITDRPHSPELFQSVITDRPHSPELFQSVITDRPHSPELFQSVITDRPHSPELFQSVITDRPHSPELFQSVIDDRPHSPELFQSVITDRPHPPELLHSVITERPHPPELFQSVINDRPHSPELFQSVIDDRSHLPELFQPVIIDSCQLSLNEVSGSNHTKEGSLIPNSNRCASSQERKNVHCKSTDVDHEREIIHNFNNHCEANNENSLYNKEKDCSAKHDSVDTGLTCDQNNGHHELLWQQLPLDSHLLPRSDARVRSFSTSNIVHTCHNPARELKIRQHGHIWQSKDPSCTATSCKIKAASEDSGVYSCADSSPASDLYTSSDIHFNDKFPASSCTCMCQPPNSGNDPALGQEIRYHQEPVGSILPGDAYVTFVHSFPMTRSRYRELCYSSERPASHSRRKISNMVYRRLEEINHQSYATTARTNLRNGYCQEPMCAQTSCVLESNSQSGYSVPLYCDRIKSQVSHSSAPATVLYRNPKQSHTNRNFRTTQMAGQFSNSPPAMNTRNVAPEICFYQQHPKDLLDNAQNRHELGKVDTSPITDPQVQLRRKRWGKSYCLPAERTRSMQIELMSRPLSLAMPVISQSNDSLSRRKQATLRDMVQHLSTHTKGIFRKRVSINNMLTWTKDSIQKPMIRSKDKSIRKEACEIFKMIQTYMGDRKGKQAQTSVALDVVTSGWAMPSLRDEIYVQLMRQTTDNKRDESLKSGWELLAICLYFFSPSPKFHPFLESYISKHRESQCNSDNIPSPEMSADCLRRLKRAQKIVSKTAVHKPTIEELEHAKATICCPTMFGNMLEDIMLLQKDRYPDRQLPWIQTVLSEEILRLHGTQTEGIFRVSGDMDEVNSMKTQCDKWILPTDCTDPHIPASLLKMWYRELFEPLIPAQFYQACVDNFSNPEAAIAIVYQLPRLNHLVLCYLIRFLQVFASPENVAFTKMDVNNLAMVMAPSCLRYESDDLLTIYEHVQKEMGFIRTLIRYLDTSFMEGIL